MSGGRLPNLRAALGFPRLPATEPELQLLHRWLDTWAGVGLITVGVERHGMRLSLSHIAEDEWRAMFMDDNTRLAPQGFGVAVTPWGAVQRAAWEASAQVRVPNKNESAPQDHGRRCCMTRATLPVLLIVLLTGCSTYSAVRYSPMAETVVMLREHRPAKVNVGRFTMQKPRGASIDCRMVGPVQTPDDEPFEEFIRKAFVSELLMAELYSTAAPVTLTGHLDHFDFSSTEGHWDITLVLTSSNGRKLTTTEVYNYEKHFMGEVACRQTAHALTPAIQNLVRKTVQHSDFAGLLIPPQTDPGSPKTK